MYDRVRLLELIESEQAADPYCYCYGPTDVVEEDGSIVLRCREASAPSSLMGRIHAVIVPHIHRVLVDREELIAA
jgi:hypothetical protein